MFIDVCSDLHVDINREFFATLDWNTIKNKNSNILIIAGDIGNTFSVQKKFLKKISDYYQYILFVDGNHEHYGSIINGDWHNNTIQNNQKYLNEITSNHPNIIYLPKNEFIIDDTVIIGYNGWYDWKMMCPQFSYNQQKNVWQHNSNDNHIRTDIPIDELALIHTNNIIDRVKKYENDSNIKNIIIITHTVPHYKLLTHNYIDVEYEMLSGSYANSNMIEVLNHSSKIKAWIYGHTHNRKIINIDDVDFINNAFGYKMYNESNNFFLYQLNTEDY